MHMPSGRVTRAETCLAVYRSPYIRSYCHLHKRDPSVWKSNKSYRRVCPVLKTNSRLRFFNRTQTGWAETSTASKLDFPSFRYTNGKLSDVPLRSFTKHEVDWSSFGPRVRQLSVRASRRLLSRCGGDLGCGPQQVTPTEWVLPLEE